MNLQARKVNGDSFTANDLIEVKFTGDSKTLEYMNYSIELVSGPTVTHGGGCEANVYLNYNSQEDADSDGDIDYSTCEMKVAQLEKGTSTIKIKGKYLTKAQQLVYISEVEAWEDVALAVTSTDDIDASTKPSVEDYTVVIETGIITLNWSEDVFV